MAFQIDTMTAESLSHELVIDELTEQLKLMNLVLEEYQAVEMRPPTVTGECIQELIDRYKRMMHGREVYLQQGNVLSACTSVIHPFHKNNLCAYCNFMHYLYMTLKFLKMEKWTLA